MLELMRFHQTSSAIVFEDEPVTPHDLRTRAFLRIIEVVSDEFEDDVIARKRKHKHHHPARAFGRDKPVVRVTQMTDEISVELRLAMPMVADRVIEIDQTFPRHEFAQAAHQFVWTFRVDAEIGAGKREQNRQVSLADKDRVEINSGFVFVPQAQRNRDRRLVPFIAKRPPN